MNETVRKSTGAGRAKAPVLQLVPRGSNPDLLHRQDAGDALRELARQADAGELSGFAYVAIRPTSKPTIGIVGAAAHDLGTTVLWLHRLIIELLKRG
ncbi:hypothetical protein ACLIKD_06855 [Azonexus sp. IMCC34842]|uniref:hypothetical protein n=1 Tax=Azonexus sp. IMCC34842 TaxID=3420950 RepID=UPI003D115556